MPDAPGPLRIGVVVVAYNAESTLVKTLDRIPQTFRERIAEIIICDDASSDDTFVLGREWALQPDSPKTYVIRHTKNLGYGGNQKAAYSVAIRHELDVVVLLHGDGQYAPECLPEIISPFERSDCAAVFGSRMMEKGAARRGGMPMYKWLGNRVLTRFENRLLGTQLSEFHSGYRAYRTEILRSIPFEENSDDFDFDTQIIAQIVHAKGEIVEVPIPTYYGDEICYVNGIRYARDVVRDVLQYRLAIKGFGTCQWVQPPDDYAFKEQDGSSHAVILQMLEDLPKSRILDVGCSGGYLSEKLRYRGHFVTGLDTVEIPGVRARTDEFYVDNLEEGPSPEVGDGYDVIIAGDVIEHLTNPLNALRQLSGRLRPGGQLLLSVPNFGHWYPRLRVGLGLFGYDRRGILDSTHLRFFTRANLLRLTRAASLDTLEEATTGLPLGAVRSKRSISGLIRIVDELLVKIRPTLFAYQYILRLTPHAEEMVWSDHLVDGDRRAEPDDAVSQMTRSSW